MRKQTKEEYNAYMREYLVKRYAKKKAEWIAMLGGQCVVCGSKENLEFDHIDPATKSFTITTMYGAAKEKMMSELAKCQLLCRSCHEAKSLKEAGGGWKHESVARRSLVASEVQRGFCASLGVDVVPCYSMFMEDVPWFVAYTENDIDIDNRRCERYHYEVHESYDAASVQYQELLLAINMPQPGKYFSISHAVMGQVYMQTT
ncbi:unnamed protein product [Sphagnum compactum]